MYSKIRKYLLYRKVYKKRKELKNIKSEEDCIKFLRSYETLSDMIDNINLLFIINNNDRVAQMVLTPIIKMELEETDELPVSIRGKGGFGSTGK